MKQNQTIFNYSTVIFSIIIICLFYFNIKYAFYISLVLVILEIGILYFTNKKNINKSIVEESSTVEKNAYIDTLTNLPNRKKFFEDVNEAKGVILIDLDDFSMLNIVYSREFGDEFLKKLSHKLKQSNCIKNLYRMGGDEFTILTKEEIDLKSIADCVMKIIDEFYIMKDNILIQTSATIGISYNKPFIEYADLALKYGKKHKLNIVIYSNELDMFDENRKFVDITMRLKRALKADKITPFFQCIKDENGNTVKYEALMRIKEGEKFLVPSLFMSIAKKTKLYTELTSQMITKTFDYMKNKNVPFSINISYDDVINKRIFVKLLKAIEEFPYPQNVIIELLETDKIENFDYVKHFIEAVHERGAKIAIDDFGSGYSNFVYLEKLNVDIIKIDGEIIKQILLSDNAMFLVRTVVEFCKKNNIVSIAEFVSHREIFVALQELGVDEYQGFYFCKPKERIE